MPRTVGQEERKPRLNKKLFVEEQDSTVISLEEQIYELVAQKKKSLFSQASKSGILHPSALASLLSPIDASKIRSNRKYQKKPRSVELQSEKQRRLKSYRQKDGAGQKLQGLDNMEEDVDHIIGALYPEERLLLQTRRVLKRSHLSPLHKQERQKLNTISGGLSIVEQLFFLVNHDKTGMIEQQRLMHVMKLSPDMLFRYDMALTDSKTFAKSVATQCINVISCYASHYASGIIEKLRDIEGFQALPVFQTGHLEKIIFECTSGKILRHDAYYLLYHLTFLQSFCDRISSFDPQLTMSSDEIISKGGPYCEQLFAQKTLQKGSVLTKKTTSPVKEWNGGRAKHDKGAAPKTNALRLQTAVGTERRLRPSMGDPNQGNAQLMDQNRCSTAAFTKKSHAMNRNERHLVSTPALPWNPRRSGEESRGQLEMSLQASQERLKSIDLSVTQSRDWMRDSCPSSVLGLSTTYRFQFGIEKLQIVALQCAKRLCRRGMMRYKWKVHEQKCLERSLIFYKTKSALIILQLSRRKLLSAFCKRWRTYGAMLHYQRDQEYLAAALTLQSLVKMYLAKCRVHHLRWHRAACHIQSTWRGYFACKMAVRHRRFLLYTKASKIVQKSFRAYVCRTRFTGWHQLNRSARILQRNFKIYMAKLELIHLRKVFYQRQSAALRIQSWVRGALARRLLQQLRAASNDGMAMRIQKSWKSYGYRKAMHLLLEDTRERKRLAAIKLQCAYRAKVARQKIAQLLCDMRERRKKRILREMWERASARSIQRWWRYQKNRIKGKNWRKIMVQKQNNSAQKIQALYKGYNIRKKDILSYLHRQKLFVMAIRIQSRWKGYRVRLRLFNEKIYNFAKIVQTVFKIYHAKLILTKLRKRKHSVLLIRNFICIFLAKCKRTKMRRLHAAWCIQRRWRVRVFKRNLSMSRHRRRNKTLKEIRLPETERREVENENS